GNKTLDQLRLQSLTIATPTPKPGTMDLHPLAQPTPRPLIPSDDLNKTNEAPRNATWESDENLKAGSQLPATGDNPLPTQEGKDFQQLAFSTHRYSLGEGDSAASAPVMKFAPAPETPPQPESTPAPPMRATAPTPAPLATPTPQPVKLTTPKPVVAPPAVHEAIYQPTPVPAVSATPIPTPDDLSHPTPVPAKPTPAIAMRTDTKPTLPPERVQPQEQPQPPQKPGFVPETQQNKLEGNISNRGTAGVDAIGTPKGRYEKKIAAAVGSLWYYYTNQRMDLVTAGTVHIRFYINEKGEAEDPEVLSNTSNQALESCSVEAILKAKLAPPPADLAESLENGRYEVDFNFTINPYQ
ncbi:MAG TPA: energy transducer TonB, partial [Chthoniobacteraceae bacterium]|nr:energy transducer TonB [Chthoniobacteraceae bacterium]